MSNPQLYVAVLKGSKEGVELKSFTDRGKVLEAISKLGQQDGDLRTLSSVFSVGMTGSVTHYQVVFEGVLGLRAMPEERSAFCGQRD